MSAKLINERTDRAYLVEEEGATIGRHGENDIPLPGRAVSRFHAEIRFEDGDWILEDHGSTYGTYVNDDKVEGVVQLHDGDKIRLAVSRVAPEGEFSFVFKAEKAGVGTRIKRAARAIVGRTKVDLGKMIFESGQDLMLVRMAGIFRKREIDALEEGLKKQLAGERHLLVLDLTGVTYMNSYGLASMVKLGSWQQEAGKALRVFGATGTVLKLLRLAGEGSPVELKRNQDEAVKTD